MANFSNTSPWIGAGQGIEQGIQNAGVISGLLQRKEAADQEAALAPLRRKALEQGVAASGMGLEDARRKEAELNRPVDYKSHPLFQNMTDEAKATEESRFLSFGPPTVRTMRSYLKDTGSNLQGFQNLAASQKAMIGQQLLPLTAEITALQAAGQPVPDEKMQLFQNLSAKSQSVDYQTRAVKMNAAVKDDPNLLKNAGIAAAVRSQNPELYEKTIAELPGIQREEIKARAAEKNRLAGIAATALEGEKNRQNRLDSAKVTAAGKADTASEKKTAAAQKITETQITGYMARNDAKIREYTSLLNKAKKNDPNKRNYQLTIDGFVEANAKAGDTLAHVRGGGGASWNGGTVSRSVGAKPSGGNVSVHRANAAAQISKLKNPAAIQAVKDMFKKETGQDL